MLERIKDLNGYQKGILAVLLAMAVLFAGVYASAISREGFRYNDEILIPSYENGNTHYSGKIDGADCCFTVTEEKAVTFRWGDRTYGPYTAREDPSAVPDNYNGWDHITGVEVREGDEVIFRGGIMEMGGTDSYLTIVDENGGLSEVVMYVTMSNGTVVDGDGNVVDPMEPSVTELLQLMQGPKLEHKGNWSAWLAGVLVSAVAIASVLFADELFRLSLIFQVRNVEQVEPSDWEISGRYIGWTVYAVAALVIYITGLQ